MAALALGTGRDGRGGGAAAPPRAGDTRDLGESARRPAAARPSGRRQFTTKAAASAPTPAKPAARATVSGDLGTLTDDVTLHWKGQAARALVFVDAASAAHIVVVADPSCAVLDLIV